MGLFTFGLGLVRFGFLASILSRPLLAGFMNAIALEIMLEQSDKFFGLKIENHSYFKIPEIIKLFENVKINNIKINLRVSGIGRQ